MATVAMANAIGFTSALIGTVAPAKAETDPTRLITVSTEMKPIKAKSISRSQASSKLAIAGLRILRNVVAMIDGANPRMNMASR